MPARTTQRGTGQELTGTAAKAAARQVRQQVTDRFQMEKSTVAREIMSVANVLRSTAEQLEGNEQSAFAGYVERAASAAERLGDAVENNSFSDIMSQVERTCRERPVVAGAVAVALGFIGARLARSSGSEPVSESSAAQKPRRSRRSAARSEESL
jgi:hypothetical protein